MTHVEQLAAFVVQSKDVAELTELLGVSFAPTP
jgi:hypothetical protein